MTFVLLYDRSERRLVEIREAQSALDSEAVESALRIDHEGDRWEIVTLVAASLEDIRSTHRRYFESSSSLLTTLKLKTQ